jgi:hypothetical protein
VLENNGGKAEDEFGRALVIAGGAVIIGVPKADLLLADETELDDVGRADGFLLEKLFVDGFE